MVQHSRRPSFDDRLRAGGVTRRDFLEYCGALALLLGLPRSSGAAIMEAAERERRPSLIWLSLQECTGCTESLTRAMSPTLETLMFDLVSLDYHETLLAPSGGAAESDRTSSMAANGGRYLLAVDGSVSVKDGGVYSMGAGRTHLSILRESIPGAVACIAVGTCASFGGLPAAAPDPTGAVTLREIVLSVSPGKPVVALPGCPPIPEAISAVVAHYVTFGRLPALDELGRPLSFYRQTIHDRCSRRPFYDRGLFARSFDDEGARRGWCLHELGCKGPTAYNACPVVQWNEHTSWPVGSGHPCFACASPGFWDRAGLYSPIPSGRWGRPRDLAVAAGVGVGGGAIAGVIGRAVQKAGGQEREEAPAPPSPETEQEGRKP